MSAVVIAHGGSLLESSSESGSFWLGAKKDLSCLFENSSCWSGGLFLCLLLYGTIILLSSKEPETSSLLCLQQLTMEQKEEQPVDLCRSPAADAAKVWPTYSSSSVKTAPSRLAYSRKLYALARAEAVVAAMDGRKQMESSPSVKEEGTRLAYARKLHALSQSEAEKSMTVADDRRSCSVEDTVEMSVPVSSSAASTTSSSYHTSSTSKGPLCIQHSPRLPPKPLTVKSMGYEVRYNEFKAAESKMKMIDLANNNNDNGGGDDHPDDEEDDSSTDSSRIIPMPPGPNDGFSYDDETMITMALSSSSSSDDNSTTLKEEGNCSSSLQRPTFHLKHWSDELEDLVEDVFNLARCG